jgi:hypothetical protein
MTVPAGSIVGFFDERDDRDSMLVGGYYLTRKGLRELDLVMKDIKSAYGLSEEVPVKWNLKDPVCAEAREAIGTKVDDFRGDLFGRLKALDLRVLMSLVWKGDPSYRTESWKWSFENILQRLCIILDRKKSELNKNHEYPFLDVSFDWLPNQKRVDEYFEVYSKAFHFGYQFIRNKLPALKDCEACPCLLVTSAKHSPALQVADMLCGAVGDFFTWVFKKSRETSVKRHFVSMYDMFHRNDDGTVIGMGLIVKSTTKSRIQNALRNLGLKP